MAEENQYLLKYFADAEVRDLSEAMTQAGGSAEALDLAFAGLGGQARLLAGGEVSSRELVELALERIEATQDTLNCFRVLCVEEAMNEAAAADASRGDGSSRSLLGVPVAIKDDVDLKGHSTPFGCGGDYKIAKEDAEMVRRLRRAGAVIIGKTNAPEVGQWPFTESPAFGITRNPWNLAHTPGGSSGGAAAAVAAGLVAGAIGSDGAGSVRIPAAWTDLVGLKPQRGRISTWPDPDAFNGLACFGPLARSVGDTALLLDAVCGNHSGDRHRPPAPLESFSVAASASPPKLRIALSFATPFGVPAKVDPEIRSAIELTAWQLAELGHEVIEADPTYGLVGLGIVPRGMAGVHDWLVKYAPADGTLERRTRLHGRFGGLLSGSAASRGSGGGDTDGGAHRARLRAGRRGSDPDDRLSAAADRIGRRPRLLGDQQRGERRLPLRLGLERDRLAGAERAGGLHFLGVADRRAAARPRERRGDTACAGGTARGGG